jgi:catechol 2,3-dioxygenase-like lactoylglutathione lyase family enzyme
MGTGCRYERDGTIAWGTPSGAAGSGLMRPYNGEPAAFDNDVMVALEAKGNAQVDRPHATALAHGGTCEGPPGPRGESGFYAAYLRTPDGNKLNAFVMA